MVSRNARIEETVVGAVVVHQGDPLPDELLEFVDVEERIQLRRPHGIHVGTLVSGKVLQKAVSQAQEEPFNDSLVPAGP